MTDGPATTPGKLFLSHAHTDKDPLQGLRRALEVRGVPCWEDARELRVGDRLLDLRRHVQEARAFLALITPAALKSEWVRRECGWAIEAEALREEGEPYRVILLFQGLEPKASATLVTEERIVIPVGDDLLEAVPAILAALDPALPRGSTTPRVEPPPPRSELVLTFHDPRWVEAEGKRRVHATLAASWRPAGAGPLDA